jgi:hypothetical protein
MTSMLILLAGVIGLGLRLALWLETFQADQPAEAPRPTAETPSAGTRRRLA